MKTKQKTIIEVKEFMLKGLNLFRPNKSTDNTLRKILVDSEGNITSKIDNDVVEVDQDNLLIPIVYTLSEIGANSWEDDIPTLLTEHIKLQDIVVGETEIYTFEVREDIVYNFDVTSTDWGTIVDADSFKTYLESGTGNLQVSVEGFILTSGGGENRIQCALNVVGTTATLSNLNIIEIRDISAFNNIEILYLDSNKLTTTSGLSSLINLRELYLRVNKIVVVEGIDNLTQLVDLYLDYNKTNMQITSTINNLTSLQRLYAQDNAIYSFPLNLILPSSLTLFDLMNNEFTLSNYQDLVDWADAQPNGTATFNFTGNLDTPIGTNFESALTAKGYNIYY